MAKKEPKKDKNLIIIAVVAILVLIPVNIYLFVAHPSPVYCYQDVCIYGQKDPINEVKALMNSSTKAIIVAEGDMNATQKTGFITEAIVVLAKDFGNKKEQLIGIEIAAGRAMECICAEFTGFNFTNCPSNSTAYCEGIQPKSNEIMLKIFYPDFDKNQIIVDNRTVKFQAISGPDALAMVNFFEDVFIQRGIK